MKYKDFELPDLIDDSLTPENAKEKGYEYVGESIYQTDAPYDAMKDIIDMVENQGMKLGTSVHTFGGENFCGIYNPLNNPSA